MKENNQIKQGWSKNVTIHYYKYFGKGSLNNLSSHHSIKTKDPKFKHLFGIDCMGAS